MTRGSIREYIEAVLERYLRATKREKGLILDKLYPRDRLPSEYGCPFATWRSFAAAVSVTRLIAALRR